MNPQLHALIVEADRRTWRLQEERYRLLAEAKAARTREPRPHLVWARRHCGRRLMALGFKVAGPRLHWPVDGPMGRDRDSSILAKKLAV
jgi:hypothetical protein